MFQEMQVGTGGNSDVYTSEHIKYVYEGSQQCTEYTTTQFADSEKNDIQAGDWYVIAIYGRTSEFTVYFTQTESQTSTNKTIFKWGQYTQASIDDKFQIYTTVTQVYDVVYTRYHY